MKNQHKKTLVLGASTKPARYSNRAIKALLAKDVEVVALGARPGEVDGVPIVAAPVAWPAGSIDTVTMYLNPTRQEAYYTYILGLKPRRIIFNPGTENQDFAQRARAEGIEVEYACTLVLLATEQY